MVPIRVLPVDEPDSQRVLANLSLHLHAIAEQLIDGAVAVVEALAGIARCLVKEVQRPRDERLFVTLLVAEKRPQQVFFDIAVPFAVGPIAEIVIG